LDFEGFYFAHLGNFSCPKCHFKMPKLEEVEIESSLPGVYNTFNTKAASLVGRELGISDEVTKQALSNFVPAFGRQEEFIVENKRVRILLSKNPAGFTESIRTTKELNGRYFLIVLNDRIPDGRDISWIWDVDFELLGEEVNVTASGDRAYDLGIRLKYSFQEVDEGMIINASKYKVLESLETAISESLSATPENEILHVLANYSAMLEARKLLGGRKIL
jgi:UDP-N-acetylmuramyl tripeptide synthase